MHGICKGHLRSFKVTINILFLLVKELANAHFVETFPANDIDIAQDSVVSRNYIHRFGDEFSWIFVGDLFDNTLVFANFFGDLMCVVLVQECIDTDIGPFSCYSANPVSREIHQATSLNAITDSLESGIL